MVFQKTKLQFLLVIIGTLAVGGLIVRAQTLKTATRASLSQNTTSQVDALPEGMARQLVLRECTGCHVLNKTTEARKDPLGWRGNVKDMIRLGAKLSSDEETAIIGYLTKHFARPAITGKASQEVLPTSAMEGMARTTTSPAQLLPDDEGKGLILATCVQCHSTLGYILGLRKDAEGWRQTVDDMIARGAQVTKEDAEVITTYLTKYMSSKKAD